MVLKLLQENAFTTKGVQLAEFDIDIQGIINGVVFKWLIECRDRPSEGPAPSSWIEQLVGRRQLFGYSKVTAVSTTGFSKGASQLAQIGNVELKEASEVTYEEVKNWIRFSTVTLMIPIGSILEYTILLDQENLSKLKENGLGDAPLIFKNLKTKEIQDLQGLFDMTLNNHFMKDSTIDYFQEKELPQNFTITGDLKNVWVIQVGRKNIPVQKILFRAKTTNIQKIEVPISKVFNYSKHDKSKLVSQSVCFFLEHNREEIDINFHHKPTTNNKKEVYLAYKKNL